MKYQDVVILGKELERVVESLKLNEGLLALVPLDDIVMGIGNLTCVFLIEGINGRVREKVDLKFKISRLLPLRRSSTTLLQQYL